MLPYWILLGIFAVGALIANPDMRADRKTAFFVISLIILSLMIGLRYRVGVDYGNYLRAWTPADDMALKQFLKFRDGDPLFYTALWGLKNLGWPYWSFNLACGIAFSIGIVQFARHQPNSWLAIAIAIPYLVIVIAMSATRQATAIGFVFLALISFKRGSTKGFLAWLAIAAMNHASAIVMLPFAGLSLARNRFQAILLLVATAIAGYVVFGATLGDYTRDYLGKYASTSGGTSFRIAMNIVPAAIYLVANRRLPLAERERVLWRNLAWLAVLSVPLLFIIQSSTALDRMLLYAFPLQIMVLAWTPYLFQGAVQQRIIIILILGYLALQQFVFMNYATHADYFVPYQSVIFAADG